MNDYSMTTFGADDLKKLWEPREDSSGEDNGQVTIIGGSKLFHGAPMLAVKAASRLVDMVFFSSPEKSLEKVTKLNSFIWVPWEEIGQYIAKSEAVLIGPGFMRFRSEMIPHGERWHVCDEACRVSREATQKMLLGFNQKKWVVDGGSLQVMNKEWIPPRAILTPNKKEFELLFSAKCEVLSAKEMAKKYNCVIVQKGPTAYVSDGETMYEIKGGNAGLTKGGTGDVLAGLIVGLLAKNAPLLAAAAGTYLVKKTAEELYEKVGYGFNSDDLADKVFEVLKKLG